MNSVGERFAVDGHYANSPEECDIVLLNLSPSFRIFGLMSEAIRLKCKHGKKLLCRLAGPISIARGTEDQSCWDRLFFYFLRQFADGIVYQSSWSKGANITAGAPENVPATVIINVPGEKHFPPSDVVWRDEAEEGGKVRLLYASWSDNYNKGGDVLAYLDDVLDFYRYAFTFVGRTQVTYSNIVVRPPVAPDQLARLLAEHDIFIFPSRVEACSNMLLEAIYSGKVVVASNTTSNPEVLPKDRGELYESPEEIPDLLDRIVLNHHQYESVEQLPTMKVLASQYVAFAGTLDTRPVSRISCIWATVNLERLLWREFGVLPVIKYRTIMWLSHMKRTILGGKRV
ncbi:glycosyltransferase [Desulfogranum mediterraneum]|uniref:glycosyltransferase n=1 Tax=Desulfogranum mediterraneum TaxID=160661 RepID=UPI000490CFC6|nr:glycosyltransferase [Desulfogranum mediterraneum]